MDIDSPLLFPVTTRARKIFVLDETRLPFDQHYIEVKSLEDALWVLETMKTRSLGQVLLFFYCCLLFEETCPVSGIVEKFAEKRPTFDFHLLGMILKEERERCGDLETAIHEFIARFDRMRRDRAARLAEILPNPASVLTICNFNGELIYLYDEMRKLEKEAAFIVCETRPYLQGTRLTFWELNRNRIPCQLICDNQAALLMKDGKVNCIVTGADRSTTRGDVINKIGTYALARLASHYGIPFYPLVQYPKDIRVEDIRIEDRPVEELFIFLSEGTENAYSSVQAIYPSFDITTHEFVSQCIALV
ncbi:MAG: hypothetical protein DRH37_01915 [Deltaproteobacteria bacterium]|nr:MAG: hypothetical protein DRH37_01915 [Deltaproteobacteria bacterium]